MSYLKHGLLSVFCIGLGWALAMLARHAGFGALPVWIFFALVVPLFLGIVLQRNAYFYSLLLLFSSIGWMVWAQWNWEIAHNIDAWSSLRRNWVGLFVMGLSAVGLSFLCRISKSLVERIKPSCAKTR